MRLRVALPRNPLPKTWLTSVSFRHLALELLVALCLAFLVWLYLHTRDQESLDMASIPVQIHLAAGAAGHYDLEIHGTSRVPVSFIGPPSRIREIRSMVQRGAIHAAVTLAVPEERKQDAVYRETVHVHAQAVRVPPGVTAVVTEGRNQIPVTLHRLAERHLPVRLDYVGDTRITQLKLEPATVLVRGPKDILDRARAIPTQPYCPPARQEAAAGPDAMIRGQASLVAELEGRAVQATPSSVTFRYRLSPRQKTYELADVPIHFLCPPGFEWQPRFASEQGGKVTLRLIGPTADEPPPVHAYIDLTKGTFGRGRNVEPLRLQLPRDFQLAQEPPRGIEFYLDPLERTSN